jgi:uncharacterized protein (DUF1778 family)
MRNDVLDHPGKIQIGLWIEQDEREIIRRAAALAERKLSDYARRTILREARKELALAGEKIPARRPAHAHRVTPGG